MICVASIGLVFPRKSINPRFSSHPCPRTAPGGHSKVQKAGDVTSMAFLLSFGFLTLFSLETEAQDIDLGGAQNVTVLGGSTVTNTGATTVTGNLAVAPGTAVTGFPPGVVVGGAIHNNDALAQTAHADTLTAYNTLAGEVSPPSKNLT